MSANAIELSDETFEDAIKKNALIVVDCWAPWCGPCRMMGPVIDQLAVEYAGKVAFGKLNIDDNQEIPGKFEVMSIPTLLIFKNGKLVDKSVGALPKHSVEAILQKHMK